MSPRGARRPFCKEPKPQQKGIRAHAGSQGQSGEVKGLGFRVLGSPLGYFVCSLTGLETTTCRNVFQGALNPKT